MTDVKKDPEAILEPDLMIVDPHHHLWDRRSTIDASASPRHVFEHTARKSPYYMLDQLVADLNSGHNVWATVYVTCRSMYRAHGPVALRPVGETEFVNGVAAMSASGLYGSAVVCGGIVGYADLSLGDSVSEVLEAHLRASEIRFRGIRNSASWDPDPQVLGPSQRVGEGLYRSEPFRKGFARLGSYGLSFDAWLLEPQLGDLIDLARAFPDIPIVLDHVGTPLGRQSYTGRRDERFNIWRANICLLGELPNVALKLGGLGMPFAGFPSFMSTTPASSAQLADEWRPYIEACIEAFGVDRCMFESNFPVDLCTCSYAVLWNAFKRITQGYSANEKSALYSGTASRFYRLSPCDGTTGDKA